MEPVHVVASVAVTTIFGKTPLCVGVPESVAVLLPLSTNVRPAGNVTVWENVYVVPPVAVNVTGTYAELNTPADSVGGSTVIVEQPTVTVNVCTKSDPTPFEAVNVIGYVPFAVVVPERVFVAGSNVTPAGSVPLSATAAGGKPVVVTVKVPRTDGMKLKEFALV